MKMKSYRGSWLVTIPIGIVALAFLMLVFLPGQRRIEELRKEIGEKQDFVMAAGQMGVRLHALSAELAETQAYDAAWRDRAINSAGVTVLCGKIAQLAHHSGIAVSRFAPGTPRQFESLQRVPLRLVASGTFGQILEFLAELEANPQCLWVDDVKLESLDKNGGAVHCEFIVEVFADDSENSG